MAITKNQLKAQALKLPMDERADLARRLIESLDESDAGDFEEEWIAEAERRYARFRESLGEGRPGEVVFRASHGVGPRQMFPRQQVT